VATKMARRCMASFLTPAGAGKYQMMIPMAMAMSPRMICDVALRSFPFIDSPLDQLMQLIGLLKLQQS
jgi:hypothetical protein